MKYLITLFLTAACTLVNAQQKPYVETIPNAEKKGITVDGLNGKYRSAVHVDSTKAVFHTPAESDSLISAYQGFLKELNKYLKANDFTWGSPTRCWNRIYFNADGAVEYYLFSFKTEITDQKQERFKELFAKFAADHKIAITANEPFAHCSSVVYIDK